LHGCAARCSFLCTAAGRHWINQIIFICIQEAYRSISYSDSQAIQSASISIWDQPEIWSKILSWQVDHILSQALDELLRDEWRPWLFSSFLCLQIFLDLLQEGTHHDVVFKNQLVSFWWGCDY
jgi:hypothetical protein